MTVSRNSRPITSPTPRPSRPGRTILALRARATYSNYGSHSNRMVPVYTFGSKVDLGAVTGANSSYRDAEKLKAIYGYLPPNTVNPTAEYCDQSELYRVQREAVGRGVKHLFVVWFDGLDWPTTQAAAIAKTGRVYESGKGSGLIFQDYAKGNPRYGYAVTSPTHTQSVRNVDSLQTVVVDQGEELGIGWQRCGDCGPNSWTAGAALPCKARGYFKGSPSDAEREVDRTDWAGSFTAWKPDLGAECGRVRQRGQVVQRRPASNAWQPKQAGSSRPCSISSRSRGAGRSGTVTSVPFCHASPAAMYAHNVDRDDYQDLAREMLGLSGIVQTMGKETAPAGARRRNRHGFRDREPCFCREDPQELWGECGGGERVSASSSRKAIDAANGVCLRRRRIEPPGQAGGEVLNRAAERAAEVRVPGCSASSAPRNRTLPYRTVDGQFDPAPNQGSNGKPGAIETHSRSDLHENPSLADMTRSAIKVLAGRPEPPFALFVESGDVDWGLHSNNPRHCHRGRVQRRARRLSLPSSSGSESHSNWDDSSAMIVSFGRPRWSSTIPRPSSRRSRICPPPPGLPPG